MPLLVNLRHLEEHELSLKGELPVAELELDLKDDMCQAKKPLEYDFEVQEMEHELLIRGELRLRLQCECVRCLKPFRQWLELPAWEAIVPLEGEEKVPVVNDLVDLMPPIREDILLALPQHPLCRQECTGLPLKNAKLSSGTSQTAETSSAWAELNKLKF